jgi:hypothetical protein
MKEEIRIMAKIAVWQEYYIPVPDGKTKEEFVKELKENDPAANHYEITCGVEYLIETEEILEVEYYSEEDDKLIDSIQIPNKYYVDSTI